MATVHQTWDPAAITTLLSTQLNALSGGGVSALGTEYDNATNLFLYALFQLDVTFGTGPTAFTTVDLFLVCAPDGTNYNNGSSSIAVQNAAIGSYNMQNVTTQQLLSFYGIPLPPCKFKLQVSNSTNQAFPATGSTVKMIPYGLKAA
jgi:hypothetical protein